MPFEYQTNLETQRRCGASALCMVLRSFDIEVAQDDLWKMLQRSLGVETDPELVEDVDRHKRGIETFRLAQYARKFGIDAIPARFQAPWNFLCELASQHEFRLILNLKVRPDSQLGHFAVFVDIIPCNTASPKEIVLLHDPQKGPNREYTKHELIELWSPGPQPSEITGFVGILAWKQENPAVVTQKMKCPDCLAIYSLPKHLVRQQCFSTVFCPECGVKT